MTPTAPGTGPRVPPPVDVPAPPADPATLDPLPVTWPAGEPFHRCYLVTWGSRDFNAGDATHRGRFHPFTPADAATDLPVLYGADDELGALSETVFHDVPVRGTKHVPYAKLRHRLVVALAPTRDLTLVDLTGHGLHRLGVSRGELIESDARTYQATAAWARALHDHPSGPDGLLWVSRQHDTSRALVLFSDRVATGDLDVPSTAVPLTLGSGTGLDIICAAADRAGITITGLPT